MSTVEVAAVLGTPVLRSLVRREGEATPEQEFWVYPDRPRGWRTEVLFDHHNRVRTVTSGRLHPVRWVIADGVATAIVGA